MKPIKSAAFVAASLLFSSYASAACTGSELNADWLVNYRDSKGSTGVCALDLHAGAGNLGYCLNDGDSLEDVSWVTSSRSKLMKNCQYTINFSQTNGSKVTVTGRLVDSRGKGTFKWRNGKDAGRGSYVMSQVAEIPTPTPTAQ